MLGKEVRMNRLFNSETGKILVVAVDHAIGCGVIPGIDTIKATVEKIVEAGPDAITMSKGTVQRVFPPYAGRLPFIMQCTSTSPYHPTYDTKIADVEEGVRLGADAVAATCTVCGDRQAELLRYLGEFTKAADSVGMPTVTHIYPKGNLIDEKDWYKEEHVKYAARVGAECGVDIVKTFYTGDPESFGRVIEATPVPVVVSGGPKLPNVKDLFETTYDAMSVGAAGITYGRNVWQAEDPAAVVKALVHIIHEKGTVKEALDIVRTPRGG